ncbi:hypothetical protein [Streptomyces sp. NPDC091371]|uniref:hypothetical protein n=1 Tax=Streptomyces sp. NPDC091371 TaxID=3155303 RepID=UPI0034319EBD
MSARQWGWAVAGVVAAGIVAALAFVIAPYLAGLFLASAVVAAVPLAMRQWPKGFATACLVVGAGLLAWALIGAVVGMFLFIPAALLLFVAAFADGRNRPRVWPAVAAPLAAAAAVVLCYSQPPDPANEPPPYFEATLDSGSRYRDPEFKERKELLRDFGATRVEVGEYGGGRFLLTVGMPDTFPDGQSQEGLQEKIQQVPGVVAVRFCTFHTCN